MPFIRRYLMVFACFALSFSNAFAGETALKLTEAQAIERAKDFCTQMGKTISGGRVVSPPNPYSQDHRSWLIHFDTEQTVEVVDETAVVCNYVDSLVAASVVQNSGTSDTQLPLPADAESRALAVMVAAGQDVAGHGKAFVLQSPRSLKSLTGIENSSLWVINFTRKFGEIPYQGNYAKIVFDADNMEIRTFSLKTWAVDITAPLRRVTWQEGAKTANARASKVATRERKFEFVEDASNIEKIASPNDFWEDSLSGQRDPSETHLVWVYRFINSDHFGPTYEMWVDQETGKIIGGNSTDIQPSKSEFDQAQASEARIENAFRKATEFRFTQNTSDTIKGTIDSSTKMLKQINENTYFFSTESELDSFYFDDLILFTYGAEKYTLPYDGEHGLVQIGPRQYGIFDSDCRKWLSSLEYETSA